MTAKEYLGQAYRLDQRINSKLEQVISLRELTTKATATMSDMPGGGSRNVYKMQDIIGKIVDLETEINADIDRLVDLKREMVAVIKAVANPEFQTLLELRYLCFKSWEQIAVDMNFSMQHSFRIHDKALKEIELIYEDESKCDRMRVGKCDMITIEKNN